MVHAVVIVSDISEVSLLDLVLVISYGSCQVYPEVFWAYTHCDPNMCSQLHQFVEDVRRLLPLEDVPCHLEGEWLIHHLVGGPLWHPPLAVALLRPIVVAVHLSGMVFLTKQFVHFFEFILFFSWLFIYVLFFLADLLPGECEAAP